MFWVFVWRITLSVLADGVLVCGIVVLLWPVIKRNSLHNA
ncbi:DUF3927 family protein [Escherichia coli]|nr:DUF3927 family protein [Escherichia coli]